MKIFGFNITRGGENKVVDTPPQSYEKFSHFTKKTNYNYNDPLVTEVINSSFIYFGEDNNYPTILNELYYSSPFHSSIINFKSINIIGGGYQLNYGNPVTEKQRIDGEQLKFIFNDNFIDKMAIDYLIHGRLTWKIYWNEEHTKITNIERIDPALVRATQKVDGKILKWAINTDPFNSYSKTMNKFEYIPTFDVFRKDERVQLWTYQSFSPGLDYYCQPSYANAVNWLYLDGQISYYHKSNIENSINPSYAVKIYEKPANNEEQQNFVRNLNKSFTGAKNAGKVMVFFSNGKELSPDIQPIQSNGLDEAFNITQEMIIKNIAFAHTIDPILMGIASPGALGQSQQLQTVYNIFTNTFVKPNQIKFEKILNFFFGVNKTNTTIKFNQFQLL